jgi:hypothetical protein
MKGSDNHIQSLWDNNNKTIIFTTLAFDPIDQLKFTAFQWCIKLGLNSSSSLDIK